MEDAGRPQPPRVDMQTLRIIDAIERGGTLTSAARSLGLSQPGASQQLQRAESRLGVQLVDRSGRVAILTEAGRLVADAARGVLEQVDMVDEQLAGLADLQAGQIRLAGFPSASATLVPRLLGALRERRPGIAVSYVEAEPEEAEQLLTTGRCDVALTCTYPPTPVSVRTSSAGGLTATPLFTDSLYAVLPCGHSRADAEVVDLIDLAGDEWVAGCPSCRQHTLDACEGVGFTPRIGFETDNFAAVVGMVAEGLGVAMLPRLALQTTARTSSVVIRRTRPHSDRTIQVVHREAVAHVSAVRETIATILDLAATRWAPARTGR